jgi:hypothetical protein
MVTGDQFRGFAMSLPEVQERETWGEATFRVRAKIFATLSERSGEASVKATLDEQAALVALDPESFAIASYVGRFGWVSIKLATVDPDDVADLIGEAWRQIAPRRLVAAYDLGNKDSP